jgi:hypothetical protein
MWWKISKLLIIFCACQHYRNNDPLWTGVNSLVDFIKSNFIFTIMITVFRSYLIALYQCRYVVFNEMRVLLYMEIWKVNYCLRYYLNISMEDLRKIRSGRWSFILHSVCVPVKYRAERILLSITCDFGENFVFLIFVLSLQVLLPSIRLKLKLKYLVLV